MAALFYFLKKEERGATGACPERSGGPLPADLDFAQLLPT